MPVMSLESRKFRIRLFMEGCVVVASILVAFFLDAWWSDRELRHEIELQVVSVKKELEENRQLVVLEIKKLERIMEGGEAILEIMTATPNNPTVTVPDSLAWLVTLSGPSLDASFGAVDALISSGRLAQIARQELRSGLAGLKHTFDDAVENEIIARQIQVEQQLPMISDRIDLGPIVRIDEEYSATTSAIDKPIISHTKVKYPNDLQVRNVLWHRMSWIGSGSSEMADLLANLDRLIAMVSPTTE